MASTRPWSPSDVVRAGAEKSSDREHRRRGTTGREAAPRAGAGEVEDVGISVRGAGGSTRITVYAHRPGTLVDLDADLQYLERRAPGPADPPSPQVIDVRLDQDLVPAALVAGVTGLEEQSSRHRAEGVLIDRGVDPREVELRLRQQAAEAGLDVLRYARELLAACTTRPPPDG